MRPSSSPVLLGAALVSSPAWWHALEGTTPLSVALTRFLVAVLLCWFALEVWSTVVGPVRRDAEERPGEPEAAEDEQLAREPVG